MRTTFTITAVLLWLTDLGGALVNFWTCPNLHIPDAVLCSCDIPHTLQCHGQDRLRTSPETTGVLGPIMALLRSLPDENTVKVLDLSIGDLKTIPDNVFNGTNLQALIVSSHSEQFALSSNSFHGLEDTLMALGLPSNSFARVPTDALKALHAIERIDLSDNRIVKIMSSSFEPFEHLQDIDLSDNKIATIEGDSFSGNRNLRRLMLDGNRLTTDAVGWIGAYNYQGLVHMEEVSLARNHLEGELSRQTFLGFPTSLFRLNLAFNNLTTVHQRAFSPMPNLESLDLSHNRLTFLEDGAFQPMVRLGKLDLSHNHLARLSPDSFAGLSSLVHLHLNDNYLTFVGEQLFKPLHNIRVITLNDNEIMHIDPMAFSALSQLESLNLEDNPLVCDCKLKGFTVWMHTSAQKLWPLPIQKNRITCEAPLPVHGIPLLSLSADGLTCSDNETPPESLVQIEQEEMRHFSTIFRSGLDLADYHYLPDQNRLSLNWSIASRIAQQHYECNAVFVFEEDVTSRTYKMKAKIKTSCPDTAEDVTDLAASRRIYLQLNDVKLEAGRPYRFCLVLFSSANLVVGCSEPLQYQMDVRRLFLDGLMAQAVPVPSQGGVDTSTRLTPIVGVNVSSAESMTVWWTFSQRLPPSMACVLNVTVLSPDHAGQVVASEQIGCGKHAVNFTGLDNGLLASTGNYRVCVAMLLHYSQGQQHVSDNGNNDNYNTSGQECVNVDFGYSINPTWSGHVLTTAVVVCIFVSLTVMLAVLIVLLVRQTFCASKKSFNLARSCRAGSSTQYSVLYYTPDARVQQTAFKPDDGGTVL